MSSLEFTGSGSRRVPETSGSGRTLNNADSQCKNPVGKTMRNSLRKLSSSPSGHGKMRPKNVPFAIGVLGVCRPRKLALFPLQGHQRTSRRALP